MASLRQVVVDLCRQAGIPASLVDVTRLSGTVRGFCLTNLSEARAAMQVLQKAFFFDIVESSGLLKCVPLNEAAVRTIQMDELLPVGGTGNQYFKYHRGDPQGITRKLFLTYISPAADYEQGSQQATIQSAPTGDVENETLALSLTDDEAKRTALTLLCNTWTGRETFDITLTLDHLDLEPGDNINIVDGSFTHKVRLLRKKVHGIMVNFEARSIDVSDFSQVAVGGSTAIDPRVVLEPGPSNLYLMDLPPLREVDDNAGFYLVVGRTTAMWKGARVYRSSDDITYEALASVLTPSVTGMTATALPAAPTEYMDRKNTLTVNLDFDGELSSTTWDALMGSANAAVVGNEIIQFQTATLMASKIYQLSGLLRGRMGTEWAVGTHAIGDTFVLLTSTSNIQRVLDGASLLGVSKFYKGVSIGGDITDVDAISFTNTGNGLRPWSPAHFRGVHESGGDWTLSWMRRTRFGGSWRDQVDPALNEETEAYIIEFLSSGVVVGTVSVTTPSYNFTTAKQTEIYGAPVSTFTARVAQISAVVGPGRFTTNTF